MKKLILFTHSFPYNTGETFIENEITYLSQHFNQIIIFPLMSDQLVTRQIPDNCIVYSPVVKNEQDTIFKGLFCVAPTIPFIKLFFQEKTFIHPQRWKKFIGATLISRCILSNKNFKQLTAQKNDSVFYFYWGIGLAYILPFIKDYSTKIVRFHGSDLYLERRKNKYIPFRKEVFSNLTRAIFISRQGLEYARKTWPNINFSGEVHYLGTEDHGLSPQNNDGTIRILSCSNVIKIKRVERIVEALSLLTANTIHWTHIGDGPELYHLKETIKSLPTNIKINLTGALTNQQVISFYQNNSVDLFINVSSTEGLPVSIMEAISFNIPIIATNVGGTNEIVNQNSGILIPVDFSKQELARNIIFLYQNKKCFRPRYFWLKKFQAKENYSCFIKEVLAP